MLKRNLWQLVPMLLLDGLALLILLVFDLIRVIRRPKAAPAL
jgi:hypothetical protein